MASHKQYDGKTDVLIDTHGGPPGRRKRLKILYIANFLADEKKTVTGIDGDIFTFSPPLEHNHIAGCEITFAALTATPSTASSTATSSSAHPSTPTHPSTTTSTSKLSRGENTITLCKTSGINVSGINVGTQFTIGGEASQLYTDLKKEYSVGDPGPYGGIGCKTIGSSKYLKSSGAWSSSLSWDGPKSSKLAKQVQNLGCRIAEYLKEESYVGSLVDYHYAYMRGYRTDAKDFAEKNKIDVESKLWKRKAWKHNYMPKHCDQEADPAVPIAGISLGDGEASARDLKLECGRDSHTITLQPCSLYVMLPPTNTPCKYQNCKIMRINALSGTNETCIECSWLHSIPRLKGAKQRLSITFRCANPAGSGGGGGSGGGAAAAAAGAPPPVSRFAFKPGRKADSGGEAAGCGAGAGAAAAAIITEKTVALAERQASARSQANRAKALERRRNAKLKRTPDGPPQDITKAGGGGSSSTYATVRPAKMAKLDTPSHTNDCGSIAADAEPETGTATANITHAALRIEAVAAAAAAWAAIPTPDEGAPAVVSDAPTVKLAVAVTTTAAANTQSPFQANREKALRLRRVSKSSPESSGGSIGSSSSRGGEVVAGGGAGNALPAAATAQSMDVDGAGAGACASVGAATEAALEAALPMAVDPEPSPILSAESAPSPTGEPPMMGSLSSSPLGAAEAHAQAGRLQLVASRLPLAHAQRLHLQDQKPVHMEVCTAASRATAAPAAPAQPASSRAEANRIAAMQRRQALVTAPTAATPPISRAEANKVAAMKRRNARASCQPVSINGCTTPIF